MYNKLRNTSIKLKMTIIAMIALIGFSSIVFSNYSFFQDTTASLEEIQQVDLVLVQMANDLQVGLVDVNRLFEAAMVEDDKDTLEEALLLAKQQRQMLDQLDELKPSLRIQAGDLLAAFEDYVESTRRYTSDVIDDLYRSDEMYVAVAPTIAKRQAYENLLRRFSSDINASFEATMDSIRGEAEVVTQEQFVFGAMLVALVLGAYIWLFMVVNSAMTDVIEVSGEISDGNLDVDIGEANSTEVKKLFAALTIMRDRLKQQNNDAETRSRRQEQLTHLNEALRGELTLNQVLDAMLTSLAGMLNSLVGAVYLCEGDELVMRASYAYSHRKGDRSRLQMGESLVGQAAVEQKVFVVRDLPLDYSPIASGLGESTPREVLVVPLVFNDHLLGVMELMTFQGFSSDDVEFISRAAEGMAIALNSSISRVQLAEALERSKQQAEALEQQQEELRATNEELEEQAAILRSSEESLQQQQEELRVMNEELEERNRLLDRQKDEIEKNNSALEVSRKELQEKARQLEMSGRYKTEFLSTMSHELRTPLNSILILSQGLMENKKTNLDEKQVEHARVINSSGRDLLMLINDILDLSKVEEGKLEIVAESMPLAELASKLRGQFEAQAESKQIGFNVNIDAQLPDSIQVDEHRLSQILRNFISNALKFTHKGQVEVQIGIPQQPIATVSGVLQAEESIEFKVIDSGIGIPQDKLDLIFEAFQQVDGTISRKYGGTGLGLTISRKLAEIMGGVVQVRSEGKNRGSEFSLYLPRTFGDGQAEAAPAIEAPTPAQSLAEDLAPSRAQPERSSQQNAPQLSNAILIVEDDANFSGVLKNLAEEFGFSAFCAHSVKDALSFLSQNRPGSIILDLGLPDAPGERLLQQIKDDPQTKDIPVHVISGKLNVSPSSIEGAEEFIAKPFGRDRLDQLFNDISSELSGLSSNRVLVIEDDVVQQEQLQRSFAEQNVVCVMAENGKDAIKQLKQEVFGAIILDLELPDSDGFKLAETLSHCTNGNTPIIIYTARDLDKRQDAQLRKYAKRIVLKTDKSISRLLNETTLFLHWLQGSDKPSHGNEPEDPSTVNLIDVEGKRLLLVDDDIRNLYSLSAVLEESGFEIATAGTGTEAIEMLDQEPRFDLVLMDVMMPEMDGLEAMRHIRSDSRHKNLPIIALTAKAMKDDRARCIEAGANDYLSKPVDTNKLKAIVKMWLGQA
ncbi:MAG: two-component system sensor histidine kinase/response regulator [Pseudomonadales bacterium]|nr:two-component system sensor histidine kinase/response regulator [Pseudomonadales bacterium]MCK5790556.1 response regulator [Ketobacter sp.]MEC8813104.1 response regulator [Pseudomonadota bacterium]HBO94814.1 two-component system sensor histidine kinase/response regulator [Gammaproteobacteria bacterium]HCB38111.1 two-component system sensor histidine kinase/response regulator [Gammaproteobacteria bacterium]|tara:strand:+ start:41832 stop:45425 length:3594 start_codon:yes stop_codon:yes gene_type:complete